MSEAISVEIYRYIHIYSNLRVFNLKKQSSAHVMASRTSFFFNLATNLLGAPRTSDNGFFKFSGLFRLRTRLTTQAVLSVACVCFSVPLFTSLYCRLHYLWIERQRSRLVRVLDQNIDRQRESHRRLRRIHEKQVDTMNSITQWMSDAEDLANLVAFFQLDRELPQNSLDVDDNDDFNPRLIWLKQDEEISKVFSELRDFWARIAEETRILEEAKKECQLSDEKNEAELNRMEEEIKRWVP
ncbi:hypothetical protein F5050DRAFT_217690 [Lentinula boryana]|uniref:Uncharacterized protein n=1 Tax=Lentinula boryana TaxID=40481 RepID=A0ABQ8QBQ6_9AGAR|nr:hypothetical protein F5050DRAFT_217690 [Lentinula boryana]